MKGLFVSLGIHAAGVVGLLTLPAFTGGDPPPVEPQQPPLLTPSIVRVQTGSPLRPPRGQRLAGGGGGISPPRPDVPPALTAINDKPLGPPAPDFGDPELPPGLIGVGIESGVTGATQVVEPPPLVRASVDVQPPRKVSGANPAYPPLALAARIQGTVVLECTIAPDGRVVDLRVLRGHPLLDAAAVQAVSGWTYVPTLLNGRPVSVLMTVTVRFQLH